MSIPSIAVVAFDQISPFHLSVPCVVFGEAHTGNPLFQLIVCSADSGPINTTAGFSIVVKHDLSALRTADTIIVPSWRNPNERPPDSLVKALSSANKRGAQIVGLCLGAFVLAEAGLLNGRHATTHWAYARDFAERYPTISVDPDVLYIEDGNVLTSAGTAAGIDCCLHLVRQRYGAGSANSIARRLVVPPQRMGGQAQFIEQPIPKNPRGSRLSEMMDWVRSNLDQPHTIDSLANQALMSRRTFTRQFRQTIGITVINWLHSERLNLAQRLLENTAHSIETVAGMVGFGSPESLRLHFRRAFGVTPTAWRATFQECASQSKT